MTDYFDTEYDKATAGLPCDRQIDVDLIVPPKYNDRVTKIVESAIHGFEQAHGLGIACIEVRAVEDNAMVRISTSSHHVLGFSKCCRDDKPILLLGVCLAMRRAYAWALEGGLK